MTPSDRWATVERLYHAAQALPIEQRAPFLVDACPDETLRREVESLLAQSASATDALTRGAVAAAVGLVSDVGRSSVVGRRFGVYQVLAPLGAGGMGEVYRARDTRLGRNVAIKIVPHEFASLPDRLARCEREARMLAALNHPHIAAIYGIEDDEGIHALVLELVDGETLAELIARGPLPVARALEIARQIADALDAAHEKGIVHRDLKPANIKITPDGVVKVLDFGLAKLESAGSGQLAAGSESPTVTIDGTRAGLIVGTAAYMSPEQARGLAVDKRTDIWAFGCVLYEMLTGRAAFAGGTVTDTLAAILEREPDWRALPSGLPRPVRDWLRRCLRKDPKLRYRDIGDVRIDIEDAMTAGSGPPTDHPRHSHVRRLAAVAVIAVAVGAVFWARSSKTPVAGVAAADRTFTRLTRDGSYSTEPALSPDGTLVVYASDRSGEGQLDLWLQRVAGGQPIRLTDDPADDRTPDFSPDGNLVAFHSERDGGGVYVMPALGGDARLVAEHGRTPRFSPDGSRIAYFTGSWLGGARTAEHSAIFVVPATGGEPKSFAESFATAVNPVWSPDGRSLLFMGRKAREGPGSDFDWWWLRLDSSAPVATGAYGLMAGAHIAGTALNNTLTPVLDSPPARWTEQGVLFSGRLNQSANLWRLPVSPQSGTAEGPVQRLTFGPGDDGLPSVDKAGNIVFQLSDLGFVSATMPLDANTGMARGPITRQTLDYGIADARNSLDDAGRFLVYANLRVERSEIWVKDLASGKSRHLVTTPPSQLNPIIARDASLVAYSVPEEGRSAGYVIRLSGGAPRRICEDCQLQGWLPDSAHILAITERAARIVAIDTATGTKADVIVEPGGALARLDVSSDGRWIAFSIIGGDVWVAPFRPGSPPSRQEWRRIWKVTPDSAERACGWSPDSRLLYLLLEIDGFRCLYAQRMDPVRGTQIDQPFVVEHFHDPSRSWGSTPYGTAIINNAFVFNQQERTGNIWLLRGDSTP